MKISNETFVAVFMESPSIAAASERLGISTSGVNQRAVGLRAAGVKLPFHGKSTGYDLVDVSRLNKLVNDRTGARDGPPGPDSTEPPHETRTTHMEVNTGIKEFDAPLNLVLRRLDELEAVLKGGRPPRVLNRDGSESSQPKYQGRIQQGISMRREALVRRFIKERGNNAFRINILHDYLNSHVPDETPQCTALGLWVRARSDIFERHETRGWYRYTGPRE